MRDILLHCLAAMAVVLLLRFTPEIVGAAVLVALGALLRELAQDDPHNILTAIQHMPSWSIMKHLEWIAPGVAVAVLVQLLK